MTYYLSFPYLTLHYITLHFITLHYITLHRYISLCVHIYYIYMYICIPCIYIYIVPINPNLWISNTPHMRPLISRDGINIKYIVLLNGWFAARGLHPWGQPLLVCSNYKSCVAGGSGGSLDSFKGCTNKMSKNIDVPSDSIISPKLAKKTAGSYQPQSVTPDALLDALSQLLVLLTIHVDVIDGLKRLEAG